MSRELGIKNLLVDWGIRAIRYEERGRSKEEGNFVKMCWEEKDATMERKRDLYSEERESFYNNLGWGTAAINTWNREESNMEGIIKCRIIDIQNQTVNSKIDKARYNLRYKGIEVKDGKPKYLLSDNIDKIEKGDSIRALLRLRSGNMEEANKYWTVEEKKLCSFCKKGMDNLVHYVTECKAVKGWFTELGNNEEGRIEALYNDELGIKKGKILNKLWKEKEKLLKYERVEE